MILIGLGANLPSPIWGRPRDTLAAVLARMPALGVDVVARSRWYESAPVPASDQPWFINGVASLATDLDSAALLRALHDIEAEFGRVRSVANAARVLDLDLLAFGDEVRSDPASPPLLPHPRLAERAFVLLPLAEIAPGWRHPVSGLSAAEMVAGLASDGSVRPLDEQERD